VYVDEQLVSDGVVRMNDEEELEKCLIRHDERVSI